MSHDCEDICALLPVIPAKAGIHAYIVDAAMNCERLLIV
jgi:hypothetical protein